MKEANVEMEKGEIVEQEQQIIEVKEDALLAKLEKMATEKEDYVIPWDDITYNNGYLNVKSIGELALKKTAKNQLVASIGVYSPYYTKLEHTLDGQDLLNSTMNFWMKKKVDKNVLLRTDGRYVRAILSPRYKAIDNYEVAKNLVEVFEKTNPNMTYHHGLVNGSAINIQYVDQTHEIHIPSDEHDTYFVGVNVQNSEIGEHSFAMMDYLYRLICTNGMILGQKSGDADRWYHIGGEKKDTNYTNDPQYVKEYNATLIDIKKAMSEKIDVERVQKKIDALDMLKKSKVEDETNFSRALKNYFMLSDAELATMKEVRQGNTYYDWLQSITKTANVITRGDNPKVRRRVELEKIGGLLMGDGKIWGHLELQTKDYELKGKKDDKK